jgi:hypothetical protein
LGRLKTSWSTTTQTPSVAALNASLWQSYRLYDRGPSYQAVTLSSSLSNVTLRPSASNPLGIFLRTGNLDIYDKVTIQGTVIVTGTVTFWGKGSSISAYNWISSSGSPVIADADQWPRLPAVVAANMTFSDSARQVIEGAVRVDGKITGGGSDFDYPSSNNVYLTGTATATRGQQPYSTIKLQGSPSLSSLSGNQVYAIWLANGTSGRWYQIDSVDTQARTLTVIGEVESSTSMNYVIRPNRSKFSSLHGPVVTGSISIDSESMWGVSSTAWSGIYSNWTSTNNDRRAQGKTPITFPDYVSNPANLVGLFWFVPWQTLVYGLQLEPTFSIQPTTGVDYLANAPLFTPYVSSGSDSAASGYRWEIVDWREDL